MGFIHVTSDSVPTFIAAALVFRHGMTLTRTFLVRCTNEEDASLLSASARLFLERGTYVIEKLSKFSCRRRTLAKYRFIDSSHASYDPFTWFVTRTKSLNTCRWRTSILMASSYPAIRSSYSASLLEAGNSKRKAYVLSFQSGFFKIRPAPEPYLLDAPSMYNVQSGVSSRIWVGEVVASPDIFGCILIEDSAMKFAITCPFIADLGFYLISCSPSSIAHLANRSKFYGLSNTCRIGWFDLSPPLLSRFPFPAMRVWLLSRVLALSFEKLVEIRLCRVRLL
nr:hypothetical protein [Tanacetum cinerariifolium]